MSHETLQPSEFRELCRRGEYTGPTSGCCADFAQANLVIVPTVVAEDFRRFCELNSKPCPLLEETPPGVPTTKRMAKGADLRTDLPRYRVFKEGELVAEPTDITDWWRDDLVGFLLGCSFTFEHALLNAGLPIRHLEEHRPDGSPKNVPMYQTNIPCRSAGVFACSMVVSMRPMTPEQADQATRVTFAYSAHHGAPVQIGDPKGIGIHDLDRPEWGDAVTLRGGEVPVFWACGVTSQAAVAGADLPFAITHAPGHMFITDRRHEEFA